VCSLDWQIVAVCWENYLILRAAVRCEPSAVAVSPGNRPSMPVMQDPGDEPWETSERNSNLLDGASLIDESVGPRPTTLDSGGIFPHRFSASFARIPQAIYS
jgi:hypothetical protein